MSQQEQLNRQGRQHIADLAATVRALYKSACKEDGIDSTSSFVIFSDGNKFVPFYNKAIGQLHEAQATYAAGGYVGLAIKPRR
mgnify:CR=1 FL=1